MMERACLPEPVALLDGHVLAGLGFPGLGKSGVDVDVELARGVVGHIEQAQILSLRLGRGGQWQPAQGQGGEAALQREMAARNRHGGFLPVHRLGTWAIRKASCPARFHSQNNHFCKRRNESMSQANSISFLN